MIKIESVADRGPVVKLKVSREIPGLTKYYTAAYWVDGLLIDTGCAHTAGEVTRALREWPVDQVVNTHSHEDHIGGNARLQQERGCSILAHPGALPILQDPALQPLQPYRLLCWGKPRPSTGEPVGELVETARFRFDVIHTPGHSPDHVCLFERNHGWLFSGDAYIGGEDRALRKGFDPYGIIDSLKMLARLPVRSIFSGSGTVRAEGARPLAEKIAYLEALGEQIHSLHNQGLSPRRIQRRLFGHEHAIAFLTMGHFSGLALVRAFLAGPATGSGPNMVDGLARDG